MGLEVKGSVFLRDSIRPAGATVGAKIGGTLDCDGATFSAEEARTEVIPRTHFTPTESM